MEESRQLQSEAAAAEKVAVKPQEEVEEIKKKTMKVMVAVDESDVSLYALKWALDHLFINCSSSSAAAAVAGGEATATATATPLEQTSRVAEEETMGQSVVIVHVMLPFQNFVFPAGPSVYATTSVVESVRKAQQENAKSVIARALQLCKMKMIKTETVILEGDPKDMICHAAEKQNVDLVVVGSRGLGTIKRAFLGSVSDYCAHHAKRPILIVRPPKEARK